MHELSELPGRAPKRKKAPQRGRLPNKRKGSPQCRTALRVRFVWVGPLSGQPDERIRSIDHWRDMQQALSQLAAA